ncbi:unnamed protein product [Rotaria sp. Silwood1]|nr:unnamed protein product [Rotaria sp. Silwood1]
MLPFRRSGLWMTIKVVLHTILQETYQHPCRKLKEYIDQRRSGESSRYYFDRFGYRCLESNRVADRDDDLPRFLLTNHDEDSIGIVLTRAEIWIQYNLAAWIDSSLQSGKGDQTFEKLQNFYENYQNAALNWYYSKNKSIDPIGYSRFILTSLTIIRLIHKTLCEDGRFQRLKLHAIRIPNLLELFEFLVLPNRNEMFQARTLYDYFQEFSKKTYPDLLSNIESRHSFGVQFADQSPEMNETLEKIQEQIEQDKKDKTEELNKAKKKYEELMKEVIDLKCECETDVKLYYKKCDRCKFERTANNIKVDIYECPIPSERESALAVIFELQMPNEIRCYRDILWLFANRPNPKPSHKMYEWLSSRPHGSKLAMFYKGPRDCKVQLLSAKQSLSETHYSAPRSIASTPLEDFFYENSLQVQITPTRPTTLQDECRTLTPELSDPNYKSLQFSIESTQFVQNKTIANLSKCTLQLKPIEFLEFGSFRSGHRLQWWNLLSALETDSLSIDEESVAVLITHALLQNGPFAIDGKALIYSWCPESHQQLLEDHFVDELIVRLERHLKDFECNWQNELVLIIITVVVIRIFTICNSTRKQRMIDLVLKCRHTGAKWIQLILKSIHNPSSSDSNKMDALRDKIGIIGIACLLTFSVYTDASHSLDLSNDDVMSLLNMVTTVHDNLILGNKKLNMSVFMRNLMRQSERVLVSIHPMVKKLLEKNSYELLNEFASIYWAVIRTKGKADGKWKKRSENIYDGWYDGQYESNNVSIDCFNGKFVVNDQSIGFLPNNITSDKLFQRVFGNHIFEVQRGEQDDTYITKHGYHHDEKVHYEFNRQNYCLRIYEHHAQTNDRFELIPPKCFEDELAEIFVSNYSHWWNDKTKIVEFRPVHFQHENFLHDIHYILAIKKGFIRTNNTENRQYLINRSSSFFKNLFTKYFIRLDGEPYVYMLADNGIINIHLSRLGIAFKYSPQHSTITSREYFDMHVDENQCFGTLTGLRSGLLLSPMAAIEHKNRHKLCRKLIVPYGEIRISKKPDRHHQTVTIDRTSESKSPFLHQYFVFILNDRLRILQPTDSPTGWLYLGLLHAVTSHCLPDQYIGMTGMERSFELLNSAGSWSDQPFDPVCRQILLQIAIISPQVNYYSENNQSMEKIEWNPDYLPYSLQHFGYYLIAKKLLEASEEWNFMYSTSATPNNDELEKLFKTVRFLPTTLLSVFHQTWLNETEINSRNAPVLVLTPDQRTLLGGIMVNWVVEQQIERALHFGYQKKWEDFEREISNVPHANWVPSQNLPWLIIELEMNITIREIQVEVARHMTQPIMNNNDFNMRNTVMQLNMGEGKTSVIVPMLALSLCSSSSSLVRIIVLKSLFPTNYQSLRHKLGGLLNRRVLSFACRRDMNFSESQANQIFNRLQYGLSQRDVVLTSPEDILSFDLLTIDKCRRNEFDVGRPMLSTQRWIKTYVRDILDESDEILHVKYQLIYSIGGQKQVDGGLERWRTIQSVLNLVKQHATSIATEFNDDVSYKVSERKSSFPEFRLLNHRPFLELCKRIAKDWLNQKNFRQSDEELILQFILDISVPITCLKDRFPYNIIQLFLVMRGLLSSEVLFVTLKKRYRVNFGVNPNPKFNRLMAVPFRAKDVAAENTEFGHPDVALVLTQISYYYSGLSDLQLRQCFDRLSQNENDPEVIYNEWISLEEDNDTIARIKQWKQVNLKDKHQRTEQLFPTFRRNMQVINYFLNNFVYPYESKQFPHKLIASPWDLSSSARKKIMTGFSGTNDTQLLLPVHIHQCDLPELKKTDAVVLNNLLQPKNEHYRDLPISASSEEILKQIVNTEPMIQVILDVGALFIDGSNRQIAIKWLDLSNINRIDYVVYFEMDSIFVCDRQYQHHAFSTSPASERLDRCLFYLDEIHTRGTDFKFPNEFRAAVTLGNGLTKDRLVQACMRMRKLGKHHWLSFWSSSEVHHQVQTLKKTSALYKEKENVNDHISLTDILRWVYENTQQAIWDGLHHWATQSLSFQQKNSAFRNIDWNNYQQILTNIMMENLAKASLEGEILDLKTMYGHEKIFQTVYEIYSTRYQYSNTGYSTEIHEAVSKRLLDYGGSKKLLTQLLDEEQQRELEREQETEEERQQVRPIAAVPCEPILHHEVLNLCETQGPMLNLSHLPNVFCPIADAFIGMTFYRESQPGCWQENLWITTEFKRVIQTKGESLDPFLRPPRWVLIYRNQHIIFLSPYEANELMDHLQYLYHKSPSDKLMQTTLRLLLPRTRRDQSILFNTRTLTIPPLISFGPEILDYSIPIELLVALFAFNGTIYFENKREQDAYCKFLGLCLKPRNEIETNAFDNGWINIDGFVENLDHRQQLQLHQCRFSSNPKVLSKDLIPEIHDFSQLIKILIFFNGSTDLEWGKQYKKVRTVEFKQLISKIESVLCAWLRHTFDPLDFAYFDTSKGVGGTLTTDINGTFLFSQLLIDLLLRMIPQATDKDELIEYCTKAYDEVARFFLGDITVHRTDVQYVLFKIDANPDVLTKVNVDDNSFRQQIKSLAYI